LRGGGGAHHPREAQLPVPGGRRRPQSARATPTTGGHDRGIKLKTAHEGGFVAQALVDECGLLLRKDHQFLRYRPVVVVGYGRIGRALARALTSLEATVIVADPNVAATDPTHVVTTLAEALRRGVFLVFGATGIPSMTPTDLGVFLRDRDRDTLYLASASSKQIEFSQVVAFFQQARTDPGLLGGP
jgi:D-isomer specific 2-hydroxyacid dehydrogenase, NAD binding domain